MAALHQGHEQLQKETRNLVTALRSPATRGRWGEMQLRRVVEAAGMLEHCDFEQQMTTAGATATCAPTWSSPCPGEGQVVVDAKVPLQAFLEVHRRSDDDDPPRAPREARRQLRTHVDPLSKKEYWHQFEHSPEFVVAFVPGDALLAAALEPTPRCSSTRWPSGSSWPRPPR